MAPLRSKINHTLHKINDKLKRHSGRFAHAEDENDAHAHQLRTLPTEGFLLSSSPPGQPSSTSAPQAEDISSRAGDQVAEPPRTSGSESASSVMTTLAYGFGPPSPAGGSAMSVESCDHKSVFVQASATTPLPLGTLGNPIANASPGDSRDVIDLTYLSPPTSLHGQKRYWAEPSPVDASNVDYAVGQKAKMHRSAANHSANFSATQGSVGSLSTRFSTMTAYAQQSFADPAGTSAAWGDVLKPASHVLSTQCHSEDDLITFREKIFATTCHRCSRPLVSSGDKITTRTRTILDAKGVLHPHLTCTKCKAASCVACRRRSSQSNQDLPYRQTSHGSSVAWCCDEGKLFLIWSLCCGPEYKVLAGASRSPTISRLLLKGKSKGQKAEPSASSQAKVKEWIPRALSKGIGYGIDDFLHSDGTFTLTGPAESQSPLPSNPQLEPERLLAAYFGALDTLLSGCLVVDDDANTFVEQPPAMVKFMLQRSPLLPAAAELLRNDSMEDMFDRRQTYEPLLRLVRTIGRHPSISAAVYNDHTLYPVEEQLVHFSATKSDTNESPTSGGKPNQQRGKGKQAEQGSSIAKIVENLARQCRHLNRVASDKEEFKVGESSAMLALSQLICDVAAENAANKGVAAEARRSATRQSSGQVHSATNVLTRPRGAEEASDDLRDLHRDASVADVADLELMDSFKFQTQAAGVSGAIPAAGRMKKLVSQIAMLRTTLPEGIWLRHGSSRLDVMKVLMTGPKGTPYENGLFEFDLFCPIDFPKKPPMLFFRTTGAGRVRFNPNLYEDGKVCLSILGTWAGPGWDAAHSTLLQVLVSIQAMILVEEPWYNEPGREITPNKAASKRYNLQIQGYTIEHAMLDWLTNRLAPPRTARQDGVLGKPGVTPPAVVSSLFGPEPAGPSAAAVGEFSGDDPIWGQIIRKHFAANGKAIVETVKKWRQLAVHRDMIARLNEALARHGFL